MRLDCKLHTSDFEVLSPSSTLSRFTQTISSVSDSAKDCIPGSAFFALTGLKNNGHGFIADAIRNGAVIVIGQESIESCSVPYLHVADSRKALSIIAARATDFPSRKLVSFAVTGTNGKTTTHCILANILRSLSNDHAPVLRTGTLGAYLDDACISNDTLTTPGSLELNKVLSDALTQGAQAWCTEASSHALSQERLTGMDFDGAIFTNLTRDHLDYHGTMENYFAAKARLFTLLGASSKKNKVAVIHLKDNWGQAMYEHAQSQECTVVSFGYQNSKADIAIVSQENTTEGTAVSIEDSQYGNFECISPLLGAHNVENVIGAYALLTRTVCNAGDFFKALRVMPQVPGRLELVCSKPYKIFVDYAHTPDALVRVLGAVKEITKAKLSVVFGCGGDRDKGKRPQMLTAALQYADRIVVTSDNPRTEDPGAIIADILAADTNKIVQRYGIIEADRKIAIHKAIQSLEPDDVLVIAGKGHEDYQIIGQTKYHFSDQEIVRANILEY